MSDKRSGKRVKFERTVKKSLTSLDDLFKVFYEAKISEGVSKRTLETYRENYKFLCEYLDLKQISHDVADVTTDVLRSYQTWLLTEKRRFEGHQHKAEKKKGGAITCNRQYSNKNVASDVPFSVGRGTYRI